MARRPIFHDGRGLRGRQACQGDNLAPRPEHRGDLRRNEHGQSKNRRDELLHRTHLLRREIQPAQRHGGPQAQHDRRL